MLKRLFDLTLVIFFIPLWFPLILVLIVLSFNAEIYSSDISSDFKVLIINLFEYNFLKCFLNFRYYNLREIV